MALPPYRVDYSPIIERPPLRWPNNARVAFWVSPNVEFYEYMPDFDGVHNPYPRSPYPDSPQYAHRDYGNRIGFWRMLESLDKYKVKCTVSLNVAVLEHFPEIAQAMVERDWAYMFHGFYNTQYLGNQSEEWERAYYRDAMDTVRRITGKQMKGMLGPNLSTTWNTPDLIAEAGMTYHADWAHDDQPVPIRVRTGKLVSIPYSLELNDIRPGLLATEGDYFVRIVKRQFDTLYREGAQSGRVMCIGLHPYIIGQPHRTKHLEAMLDYILSHEGVWMTTADEIADYYMANYYDQALAHAKQFNT